MLQTVVLILLGALTIPTAETVGQDGVVFAVDVHPLAIQAVKSKASRKSLGNVQTVLVKGYDTGIQSSSIDRVLLIDTFHAIEDREALLREIDRVLKLDGLLLMALGHMSMSQQQEIVLSSGFFKLAESWDRGVLFEKRESGKEGCR